MGSIHKRHDEFIRELQAPLKEKDDYRKKTNSSDEECEASISEIELRKELERKFDELFGVVTDETD